MFSENLRNLRKAKGISQEAMAEQLHVVRQTISKWEKGLSVPDAGILIRVAEILEVSVGELLGSPIETPENVDVIAQKLEQINFSLAERNRRSRLLWKIVAGIAVFFAVVTIALMILSASAYRSFDEHSDTQMITQTEAQAE
ncbi:helix-turn-helix domain-containing protein [Enterocloster sp. OA13]|uniref:helix-turn-helix domain-containing protein n=1 Tax=Enterocloster sp. OA13 TaxID=2914161 RepID=UPI00046F8277|nr:helix-turn-helix domain-containing protein [Enterocloster sp. OA13]